MSILPLDDLHSLVSTLNGGMTQRLAVPTGLLVMLALNVLAILLFLKKKSIGLTFIPAFLGFLSFWIIPNTIWAVNNQGKKMEIEQVREDYPSMELCKTTGEKCYLVLCKNQKQANEVEDNHKTNGYPTVYFDGDNCSPINQNIKMNNITYVNKTPTDKEIVSTMQGGDD